ncbi:S8 family serine peptidase [Neptuniibacter halophilus]|uniref:S8 family serine peptidase n=1 Tax=Neptuniibacter halophilus TaxID=651666 RepID=UPI00257467FB|nr:S8 family serine peptidase [Neptuniibacter halophilus]
MRYPPFLSLLLTGFTLAFTAGHASAAARPDITDQLIVQFDTPGQSGVLKANGLSRQINKELVFVRETALGAQVYKLPDMESLSRVRGYARALQAVSGVKNAEADQLMHPIEALTVPPEEGTTTSGTPIYNLQWHYYEATAGMNAKSAWLQLDSTDPVVNVAVLDTGILPHPDLTGNYSGGADMIADTYISNDGDGRDSDPSDPGDWNAVNYCGGGSRANDSSWHGTHVAGTINAATHNQQGVAGVGYNHLNVVPVRVLGQCGGYVSDIADGIIWAAQGLNGWPNPNPAKVINMSLGGSGACGSTYQQAIDTAVAAGTTVVVAAGNSGTDAGGFRPANCDNVITVAATGRSGSRAYYSNYGDVVDLAAPGGEMNTSGANGVLSTLNDGTTDPGNHIYAYSQGTSMATPHVAAAAGLLYVKDPNLTPAEVETLLTGTARSFPGTCTNCGSGLLDAGAALAALDGGTPPPPPVEETVPDAPGSFSGTAGAGVIDLTWLDNSDNETSFYIERRKKNRKKWSGFGSGISVAADATSYQDTGLDGTYQYRIRSQNSAGVSAWVVSGEIAVSSGGDSGGGDPGGCKGGWKKCGS